MNKRFGRKGLALVSAAALLIAAGGAAYAYFTTTGGTGTGSASTSSGGSVAVTVENDLTGDLAPAPIGDSSAVLDTISFTVTTTAQTDSHVSAVTMSIPASFSVMSGGNPACVASDFSINSQPVTNTVTGAATPVTQTVNVTLAPASAGAPTNRYQGTFTIQLVENGANQDSCANLANIPLTVVAS